MEQSNILDLPIKEIFRLYNTEKQLKTTRLGYENAALNCKGAIEITETIKFSYSFSQVCVLCNHKTPCFAVFNVSRRLKRSESVCRRSSRVDRLRAKSARVKKFRHRKTADSKEEVKREVREIDASENDKSRDESLNLSTSLDISSRIGQAENEMMVDLQSKRRLIKQLTTSLTKEFKKENKLPYREVHYLKRIKECEIGKLARLKNAHKVAFNKLKKELKERNLHNYFDIDEIMDSNEAYLASTRRYTENLKEGVRKAMTTIEVLVL
eukprot:TRINITY_DN9678_c0_g1_i2.p1 TRINITY_DN9678_c0_g1~~TRINITY_DN9678_c0_g1_i2.p1  ORF type:complete len:268 (+),score=68.78 TRINITY_DN9678_c0_g1_i2:64-867(+)